MDHLSTRGGLPVGMKTVPNNPMDNLVIQDKELERVLKSLMLWQNAAAKAMKDSFSDAWEDIFGEANSLLEKFLHEYCKRVAGDGGSKNR